MGSTAIRRPVFNAYCQELSMTARSFSVVSIPCAALLALAAGAAQAAPADDARVHFQAIAAGDVPALMQGYAEHAQFQWVGGGLDGAYGTSEAIREVWTRFAAGQGPLKLTVGQLEESANPKGATVSANVLFEGKAPIKVRYVLTYREGKIVNEVWQIDPKLNVAAAR
jgi:ketosteroid isomerase-like protein